MFRAISFSPAAMVSILFLAFALAPNAARAERAKGGATTKTPSAVDRAKTKEGSSGSGFDSPDAASRTNLKNGTDSDVAKPGRATGADAVIDRTTNPNTGSDTTKNSDPDHDTTATKGTDLTGGAKDFLKKKGAAGTAAGGKKGRATEAAVDMPARLAAAKATYDKLEAVNDIDLLTKPGTDASPGLRAMFTPVKERFGASNPTVTGNMDLMKNFSSKLTGPDAVKNQQAVETALAIALFQISKIDDPAKRSAAIVELRGVADKLADLMGKATTPEAQAELLKVATAGLIMYGPHNALHNPNMTYAKLSELLSAYGGTGDAFSGFVDDMHAWSKATLLALAAAAPGGDKSKINLDAVRDAAAAEHKKWLDERLVLNGVDQKKLNETEQTLCQCEGCEVK